MGFSVGYIDFLLPNLFLYILSILSLIKNLLNFIFSLLGNQDYLEPNDISSSWPPHQRHAAPQQLYNSQMIQESLPAIVKFFELADPPESCAICLHEFEAEDEIRPLVNCKHVFHRDCLDRWIDYHHRTCPLCRMPLVNGMMLWAASSGIPDVYEEFSHITAGL